MLEIPPTPGLQVRRFGHSERRREAREEVAVVLASFASHPLRAHEALGRPDALSGFFEVIHRLVKDGVFFGHDRSIRTSGIRSLDAFIFSRENPYMLRDAMLKLLLVETLPYAKLIED